MSLTGVTSNDGTVTYTYDPTGQLTAATYSSSNSQSPIPNPSESYVYDLNGNRVSVASGSSSSTYVIGAGNRLISDGTCTYSYDAEGNRTARWTDVDADGVLDAGDTDVTEYTWDNRNRLVKVTDYATFGGDAVQIVGYSYDVQNRWIGEQLDSNGDGVVDHQTAFVYDGHQIALQFDKEGPGDVTGADLSHRYLWGAAVDQLLCDEQVADPQTPGNVVWPLTDHLGTVRDLAILDTQTGETSVANHRVYDSFGKLVSQTNAAVDCLFGFTGRPLDQNTGLQNNVNRWYDAEARSWINRDPSGFRGKDANLYRLVLNSPVDATDPSGLGRELHSWRGTKDGKSGTYYQWEYWDWNWFFWKAKPSSGPLWGPLWFEEDIVPGVPDPGGLGSTKARGQYGKVGNGAEHVEKGVYIAGAVVLFLLPGPEDAVAVGLIESVVAQKLAAQGLRIFSEAGQWVFEKAGKRLIGGEQKAAMQLAVNELKAAFSSLDDAVALHAQKHWNGLPCQEIKRLIENVRENCQKRYFAPTGRAIYIKGDTVLIYDGKGGGTILKPSPISAIDYYLKFIKDNPGGR